MENVNENDFIVLENFCNSKLDELIQITILERKDKGFGALFLEINRETNNVDCRFVNKQIAYNTPGFQEIYDNLESNHRSSVVFFVLVTYNDTDKTSSIKILNTDLDKKS